MPCFRANETRSQRSPLENRSPDGARSDARDAGMGLRLASFEALQQGGVLEFGPTGDGGWRVRLVVALEQDVG